jgi:hypothetical protein
MSGVDFAKRIHQLVHRERLFVVQDRFQPLEVLLQLLHAGAKDGKGLVIGGLFERL